MADPMRIRANLVGDSTEVKVLMSHQMETGQRKDAQGKIIPAWFIQNVAGHAQRQDGPVRAVGHGDFAESVPRVQVQGRRQGRQGAGHVDRQPRRQAHGRGRHRMNAQSQRCGKRHAGRARASVARVVALAAFVARDGVGAVLRGRRNRQISRRAEGRQPGRAVGSARRGLVDAAARPEAGFVRALRLGAGTRRRQRRLRADAALLRRRRSRDGPRVAPRLLHGHAAGLHRGRREEESLRRRQRAQVRHGSAGRLCHVGVAWHAR